jgi:hypothetical protein
MSTPTQTPVSLTPQPQESIRSVPFLWPQTPYESIIVLDDESDDSDEEDEALMDQR